MMTAPRIKLADGFFGACICAVLWTIFIKVPTQFTHSLIPFFSAIFISYVLCNFFPPFLEKCYSCGHKGFNRSSKDGWLSCMTCNAGKDRLDHNPRARFLEKAIPFSVFLCIMFFIYSHSDIGGNILITIIISFVVLSITSD